jgi:hypothetical protein
MEIGNGDVKDTTRATSPNANIEIKTVKTMSPSPVRFFSLIVFEL